MLVSVTRLLLGQQGQSSLSDFEWKWLQDHVKFTKNMMARNLVHAIWYSRGWDNAFRSWTCSLSATHYSWWVIFSMFQWIFQSSHCRHEDSLGICLAEEIQLRERWVFLISLNMKRCFTACVMRKIQIKSFMIYHNTSIRRAKI